MNSLQKFLNIARNTSTHPLIRENNEYLRLFEKYSKELFNTDIIEIYSSNVFPETLKFKDGSKFLVWDSSYWNIFTNIIILYFMATTAQDERVCEWIKQRLEAEIYYFLSLKMDFCPELSTELARSYRVALNEELEIETTFEQLNSYGYKTGEFVFIAKVFCLFHELNHMDNIEESEIFNEKVETLVNMFDIASSILRGNKNFLKDVKHYYSEDNINLAIKNIIERKMPELEVELTCDLAAINDTVDFLETIMPDLSKEEIFSRVNEVNLVVNSINLTLTQTYRYWLNSYKLYSQKIDIDMFSSEIKAANQDAILRYVLSDIVKAIQANDVYGERILEIMNTDYYGIRYQSENAFVEDVMRYINNPDFFSKIYSNSCGYIKVSECELDSLKNVLLNW